MKGLAQALRLKDAFAAVQDVRRRGVPKGDEVPFGVVVTSPLAPGAPLTVVQPHEGSQVCLGPRCLRLADPSQAYRLDGCSMSAHPHAQQPASLDRGWATPRAREPTAPQVAACASSRYEFAVFSGSVVTVTSEALASSQSLLLAFARSANLWRKPPLAAVHQMVVQAPDGRARTFRFGTATADVPAQVMLFS